MYGSSELMQKHLASFQLLAAAVWSKVRSTSDLFVSVELKTFVVVSGLPEIGFDEKTVFSGSPGKRFSPSEAMGGI